MKNRLVDLLIAIQARLFGANPNRWPLHPYALVGLEFGTVQLPPNSTGTTVRTVTLAAADSEIIILGGPDADAERVAVKNTAPAATAYGLTARNIPRREGQVLSTTALGISGVFTQAWQDGNQDGVLFVQAAARADVASATNGFVIQETDDDADANFTRTVAQVTVSANTTTFLYAAIRGRKWRVQYTNGGTAQASFKLTAAASTAAPLDLDSSGRANVVVATALPAGTANIGKVDARARNAADSAYVEPATDRATAAGPFSVRLSDGAAFYDSAKSTQLPAALVSGRLDINVGAFGAQPAASHTRNEAFTEADAVGGELDDTTPVAATEGNVSPVRITAQRAFHVNLRSNAGTELGTSGAPVRTDPTGTTAQPVSDNAGSLTVDAPVGTPVAARLSDGAAFIDPRDVSDRAARIVGQVEGRAADGIAVAGNPVRIAGKDAGGLTQDVATDAAGELQVDVLTLPALVAGAANIGDVDVLTLPANASVNVNQVAGGAAATAGTGRQQVLAVPTTADPLDTAGVAVPIKYVRINATASGDNVILAAVASKKIRVLGYAFTASAAVAANFQDTQATPVVHAGPFDLAANGGVSYAGGLDAPAFETGVGFGLEMNLGAVANVRGHLSYQEV